MLVTNSPLHDINRPGVFIGLKAWLTYVSLKRVCDLDRKAIHLAPLTLALMDPHKSLITPLYHGFMFTLSSPRGSSVLGRNFLYMGDNRCVWMAAEDTPCNHHIP